MKEDTLIASPNVKVLPSFVGEKDLVVGGGKVVVDGKIGGNLRVVGGDVEINGVINGFTRINANKVVLGPNAELVGNFEYSSPNKAEINEKSKLSGETIYHETNGQKGVKKIIPTFWSVWALVKFMMLLIGALVLHGIFRRISDRFVLVGSEHALKSLAWGFVFTVAVPVAIILVLLTFVGLPFVFLGGAVYITMLVVAFFYEPILAGSILTRLIKKEKEVYITWKTIVLGVLVLTVLDYIKYAGALLKVLLFFVALGAILTVLMHKFREVR